MELIDEKGTKHIHIGKIRGTFLFIFLGSQWCITPSCFDHICKYKCSNDGRHLMFVVPLEFLAEKYALDDCLMACCVPL